MRFRINNIEGGYRLTPTEGTRTYRRLQSLMANDFFKDDEYRQIVDGQVVGGFINKDVKKEVESGFKKELIPAFKEWGLKLVNVGASSSYYLNLNFKRFPIHVTDETNREHLDGLEYMIRDRTDFEDAGWNYVSGKTPKTEREVIAAVCVGHVPIGSPFTDEMQRKLRRDLGKAYRDGKIEIVPGSKMLPNPTGESLDERFSYGFELRAQLGLDKETMRTPGIGILRDEVEIEHENYDLFDVLEDGLVSSGNYRIVGGNRSGDLCLDPSQAIKALEFMKILYQTADIGEWVGLLQLRNDIRRVGSDSRKLLGGVYKENLKKLLETADYEQFKQRVRELV